MNPPTAQKKKTVKVYAVVWSIKGASDFEVPVGSFISVEPKDQIKVKILKRNIGRPIYRYTDPLAIFQSNGEAEAFRDKNPDWKVVPCIITFTP